MAGRAFSIGLDVGGTKIAGGLVCLDTGKVSVRRVIATRPERGGEAMLAETLAMAGEFKSVAEESGASVESIGAGIAELVDLDGNLQSSHLLGWGGLAVRDRLSEIAPAVVESDVRAAALAEARYGAGRPYRLFVYISVGTGISSSFVQDGRPFPGARGNALVLSSAALTVPCNHCGKTASNVLEEFAAGPAIALRYQEHSGRLIDGAEEVLVLAAEGDALAIEIAGSAGDALGNSVAFLVNVLDPEAVIVGGGLGLAGGLFWDRFDDSTRAHIWSDGSRDLPILRAALGPDAGLIGAAAASDVVRSSHTRRT